VRASGTQSEQLKKQLASAGTAARESAELKVKMAAVEKDLAQKTAQVQSLQEKVAELQKKLDAALQPPAKPAP